MIVIVNDATHADIHALPKGQLAAGYTTGSPDIRWTDADWAAHPNALRIDQDTAASDYTADYLDVERYAATSAEAAAWYQATYANYVKGTRPGQRHPGIYTSQNNVTPLVNALIADGVTSGPRLIIANWSLTEPSAVAAVLAASGPFPIAGVQFRSLAAYDINVMDSAWLDEVSIRPPDPPTPHPAVVAYAAGGLTVHQRPATSTDGGKTWVTSLAPTPGSPPHPGIVVYVAIEPLIVHSRNTISTDGGHSWVTV